jgi:integral membrane protein (TIGR01906 family)
MSSQTYDTIKPRRDVAGRLALGRPFVGALRNLATVLFVLSIPVALLTTNIRFIANEPRVYRYAIDDFGAVQTTGISRDDLLRGGAELRRYFNDSQDTVSIRVEQNGREVSLFNPAETSHLRDVKERFRWMNRVQEGAILFGLTYIAAVVLWAREISVRRLAVNIAAGCALTLASIGAASGFALSGFAESWEGFHEVMFSGNWRFNPLTDHLIQIYPPAFWESIVFFIGLLVVAEAALILIAAAVYLGVTGRQPSESQLSPYYAPQS